MKTTILARLVACATVGSLLLGGMAGCTNKTVPTGRVVAEDNSPLPDAYVKAQNKKKPAAKPGAKPAAKPVANKSNRPAGKPVASSPIR